MAQTTAVAEERRGPLHVLVGVLLRPQATMAYLGRARRRWWSVAALLMVAALTVRGFAYASANVGYLFGQQTSVQSSTVVKGGVVVQGPVPASPAPSAPSMLTTGLAVAGRVVGTLIAWLAWAGLLYLATTFLGQNGAHFGGFFAMVAWSWMPFVVRNVIQAVYTAVTHDPIYNQGLSGLVLDHAPLPPAVGFRSYVPPARGAQVLSALLARVDVYTVWNLALLVLGVTALARLSRAKATIGTLVIWVLFALLGLLPALIGLNQGLSLF